MITLTTTSDITVSWNIAYGKKGFPRSLTSSLYCWKTRRRSTTRSLATHVLARLRAHEPGARAVRRDRLERAAAGGLLRPRRRGDTEADHQVEMQPDQREDAA